MHKEKGNIMGNIKENLKLNYPFDNWTTKDLEMASHVTSQDYFNNGHGWSYSFLGVSVDTAKSFEYEMPEAEKILKSNLSNNIALKSVLSLIMLTEITLQQMPVENITDEKRVEVMNQFIEGLSNVSFENKSNNYEIVKKFVNTQGDISDSNITSEGFAYFAHMKNLVPKFDKEYIRQQIDLMATAIEGIWYEKGGEHFFAPSHFPASVFDDKYKAHITFDKHPNALKKSSDIVLYLTQKHAKDYLKNFKKTSREERFHEYISGSVANKKGRLLSIGIIIGSKDYLLEETKEKLFEMGEKTKSAKEISWWLYDKDRYTETTAKAKEDLERFNNLVLKDGKIEALNIAITYSKYFNLYADDKGSDLRVNYLQVVEKIEKFYKNDEDYYSEKSTTPSIPSKLIDSYKDFLKNKFIDEKTYLQKMDDLKLSIKDYHTFMQEFDCGLIKNKNYEDIAIAVIGKKFLEILNVTGDDYNFSMSLTTRKVLGMLNYASVTNIKRFKPIFEKIKEKDEDDYESFNKLYDKKLADFKKNIISSDEIEMLSK